MDLNDYFPIATRVPPIVKHAQAIKKFLMFVRKQMLKGTSFMARLKQAVFDAVDAKMAAEGRIQITIFSQHCNNRRMRFLVKRKYSGNTRPILT